MAQISAHIASVIRENYSQIGHPTDIVPVNAGNISKTFKIITDTSNAYILKAKPDNLFGYQTTVDMHGYLAFLAANGLPVPNIVTSKDQRTVVQDGTTLYELQVYIEHQGNLDLGEFEL